MKDIIEAILIFCMLIFILNILKWGRFDYIDMQTVIDKCEPHKGLLGVEMDLFDFDIYCTDGSQFINNEFSKQNHS